MLRGLVGIAPERKLPAFATEPFKLWLKHERACGRHNGPLKATGQKVILWADTFNNYFHPRIARAALEVLEDAGFHVEVPEPHLCCGRPLYDYGMLETAAKYLHRILEVLSPEIQSGTPVVVLEPSCASVFREELTNLLPHNLDAQRLRKQTFLLSEFLVRYAPGYPKRKLEREAIIHGHCHHRAIMGMKAEQQILKALGLDSGCCGMAGAFGFEKGDHYEVSVKCAERVLLPAVRKSTAEMLLITNGFSCHEQIRQLAGREAMHLAEVLQLAIKEGKEPRPGSDHRNDEYNEEGRKRFEEQNASIATAGARRVTGLGFAALALAAVAKVSGSRRHRAKRPGRRRRV